MLHLALQWILIILFAPPAFPYSSVTFMANFPQQIIKYKHSTAKFSNRILSLKQDPERARKTTKLIQLGSLPFHYSSNLSSHSVEKPVGEINS